ncbi:Stk1 family PASTA domain-containing Ser/Thr kinase [Nocardioides sp. CFH 31398]|uniref:Stk1 family PASTA domain-containing Ser/Thr kinase n=1 Tax=Nocardioides sp. CFH 31398 TaxID=2919579 RepID=UPI001F05E82C|nr:Stk1 family PASTA domain-containing Ser/Thr kinase [Nocardioides sp. CFH 31398]MCH1868257.1 PASTA domain-containing protein [Nocardioides sp. CFH 31398]
MSDGHVRERGPAEESLEGRLVDGRYRVGPRIARGGMATVHVASDTRLDRTVALKVMHSALGDDEEFVARFVREARSAARLSHPNVVAVHDQGEDGGLVYLVMEHLPGRTLRDVVRDEAPMPPARALRTLEPVLAALAAAHRAGIVHRDVKPENVLIADVSPGHTEAGARVKVADFGLAKAVSAESQHTATGGVLIGTVSYLAPELLTDGRADPRVDVYAAGIVLHELLTGLKPHRGDTPIQIAYHHVHTDVPAPSASVPGVPAYVDALVARACVRDPGQRPADAGVLLRHVRRVLQALDAGVVDDPDLVQDLRPVPPPPPEAPTPYDAAGPDGDPTHEAAAVAAPAVGGTEDSDTWLFGSGRGDAPWPPADDAAAAEPPVALPRPDPTRERGPQTRVRPGATDQPDQPDRPDRYGRRDTRDLPAVPAYAPPAPAPVPPGARPGGSGPRGPAARTAGSGRPGRGRSRRRAWLVGALVLLLAAGAGGWWLGFGRWTDTPGVVGLDEQAAAERLQDVGLDAEVTEEYSETVPAGEVMSTDPARGDRVLDGGTVTLTLSLGPERVEVPRLRGRTEDQAQDALLGLDLVVGDGLEQYSDSIDEGDVVGTDPEAGTELSPGSRVSIVVSLGPEPVTVEELAGQDADEVEQRYTDAGLEVVRTEESSDTVEEGLVVSSSPGAGEELLPGETLEIVVSTGAEGVVIPEGIVNSTVDEARRTLEDLGLVVVEEGGGIFELGYVTDVDPGEGETVEPGSTVTLTVL